MYSSKNEWGTKQKPPVKPDGLSRFELKWIQTPATMKLNQKIKISKVSTLKSLMVSPDDK